MDPAPAPSRAPAVVAVVVAHDPGSWFEDALASLGAQDYPNLSVLVIDAASTTDALPRVASVLPGAYVRRIEENPGFGAAANEVLEAVDGADYFAFLHDDVRLAPDAVRLLVEEALRSNAGITGPKVAAWGSPANLLQVGMSIDKTGAPASSVERGELDQEQHDRVRDVFWVPGACLLVRTDLFTALGGFDRAITFLGEDLDLCWRAQVAGARVVVVPGARVEHLEALSERRPVDDRRRLQARHRLRTLLVSYGLFHLLRVLPQAALVSLVEVVYAVVAGRFDQARDVAGAWTWNVRRLPAILSARRALRPMRSVGDAELRRLQVRGSARFTAFVRGELGGEDRMRAIATAGRDVALSLRRGPRRTALVVWSAAAAVLLAGSRELIGGTLPAIGGFAPFPDGARDFLGAYTSGFRAVGLGAEAPAPTAFGLLGAAGALMLGAMGQLQKLLVLGMVPAGLIGAWRLAGPLRSSRARLAALVVYASIPLPYDALARGRWGGLLLYAGAPWVVAALLRAGALPPFAEPSARRSIRREVTSLGVVVALLAAFVPFVVLLVPGVALALMAASFLAGDRRAAARSLAVACGAGLLAVVLHLPWALDFLLPGAEWSALGGVEPMDARDLGFERLLRFETGPVGAPPIGWAFLVAAALPLLVGQGWRFGWAVRAWSLAVGAWAAAWAAEQGWVRLPPPEVLLAFAAVGIALCVALGVAAFEQDLARYRFGWRQAASALAAAAVAIGATPVVGAAVDGRWHAPDADFVGTLAFLDGQARDRGAFRMLWLGHPEVLPLSAWRLDADVAYATSDDGPPDARDLWVTAGPGPTPLLADAVELAVTGRTNRLGRLLAPMGVRYIALAARAAPEREGTPLAPLPAGLVSTMASQLDLRRVEADPALVLYENTAFAPARSAVPPGEADRLEATGTPTFFDTAVALPTADWRAALVDRSGHARFEGDLPPGALYVAAAASQRWQLSVDGERVERRKAFGWANLFEAGSASGGSASGAAPVLRFDTPLGHHAAVAAQIVLWALAARALLLAALARRRERSA